jgi:curli production assembly/transport component CsgF
MKKATLIISILLVSIPCMLFSQNIVYKPINPFFGGDTFNYQQLLAAANAQNDFEEEQDFGLDQPTDLENFTANLNRQLLNSISQDLFQQQFGDTQLTEGTYVFGSLVVDISPGSTGLVVNILDTNTGEQTQIIIPN